MESWRFDSFSTDDDIFGSNMTFMSTNTMCFPQTVSSSLFSPVIPATHNKFSEEHESSSKLSSSVVESNCRESGLFDRIVHQENAQIFSSSETTNKLSSTEASTPSKQTRIEPFCQVHGCNKSLFSCKDYYKRHKVCEVHSKTAKVIVNGIEQRFCQQCSRFHILSEFDDGKRSCRKRLADHNERRRKPHICGHSSRHARLLQSYNINRDGGKFKGWTRTRATSSSALWDIKLEDEMANDLGSVSSITDEQLHSKSLSSCNYRQQYPTDFCPFFNKYPTGGTDDFILDSRSALSLLSSQSQNASSSSSSSCHSSMNSLSHNAHRAYGASSDMNPENWVWCVDESTMDLLQLSSELERVEHQKDTLHIECTNGV